MGDPGTFHAALSPSARHRWGACPGSVREEARYPEPPDSPSAIDGTRTHALLEELIKNKPPGQLPLRAPQMLVGTTRTDEYGTYTITQDRIDRLNVAIDYIRAIPGVENAIAERRVYPDGLVGRADMSGTVDIQIPDKDVYHVIDYKDGMGVVEAKDNPQLEQYAAGVLAGLEKAPKSFQLTIIQPKIASKGGDPISTYNLPTKALLEKIELMKAQAAATDDPNAPLIPGDKQCKWCKAKGSCPALAQKAMGDIGLMFDTAPVAQVTDIANQAAQKDPTQMGADELRKLMEAAPLVRQMLDGAESEVKRRLESGIPVPGLKLVRGNGTRQWSLPEEEMVTKLGKLGVPKAMMYEKKLLTPAKIEKLTWTKDDEPVKLSKTQIDRMNQEYVVKTLGKVTVAPESDPRPAIVNDASSMFTPVESNAPVIEAQVIPPLPSFLQVPSWLK